LKKGGEGGFLRKNLSLQNLPLPLFSKEGIAELVTE